MTRDKSPRCVVVGIDGSRGAIQAALWAVDEAADRGAPLRLVCAIDPVDSLSTDAAKIAVHQACTAIEAEGRDLEIEVEISHGPPTEVLLRASRGAAMLCVGALGVHHFAGGRVGSTAESLASAAHCPVSVVHGRGRPASAGAGWVMAEVDKSVRSDAVLELAVHEAVLRHAPLRVVEVTGDDATLAAARLERRLDCWRRRHPLLEIDSAVTRRDDLDYLRTHARDIAVIVTGTHNGTEGAGARELASANGHAVLTANQRAL